MSVPKAAGRQALATKRAPAAIGPYSQAIRSGSLLFVSGQIALDPTTGQLVGSGDVPSEARQVLENLSAILDAAGTSFANVVKTTVYLVDMADFSAMNEVYATYFPSPAPARATVAVAGLPRGARVEIELIAEL
jgi:2-iminobutanoate/2-iminopropanoate deaminase